MESKTVQNLELKGTLKMRGPNSTTASYPNGTPSTMEPKRRPFILSVLTIRVPSAIAAGKSQDVEAVEVFSHSNNKGQGELTS